MLAQEPKKTGSRKYMHADDAVSLVMIAGWFRVYVPIRRLSKLPSKINAVF